MKYCIPLLLLVALVQCKTPSERIREAFEKVDRSLKQSNNNVLNLNQMDILYENIQYNKQANPVIARQADTIFHLAQTTCAYVDTLEQAMLRLDTTGIGTQASEILVTGPGGDILEKKLLTFYYCLKRSAALTGTSSPMYLDSTLHEIGTLQANKDWKREYFADTPTVGAATILSKFKNDCINAAIICLKAMKEQMTS